jgi:hypothetical protein
MAGSRVLGPCVEAVIRKVHNEGPHYAYVPAESDESVPPQRFCRQFPQDSAVGKSSFAIDEELN